MINIIGAASLNGIIGVKDNDKFKLPWELSSYPEDIKFFKEQTINSVVVMGSNTFKSIGRLLPKRTNIVLTSNPTETYHRSCLEEVTKEFKDFWIIGGESLYREALMKGIVDKIYLTIIPENIDCKKYSSIIAFPWINPFQYKMGNSYKILTKDLVVCEYSKII
jgi:dihydrofolate reductase